LKFDKGELFLFLTDSRGGRPQ